MDVRDTLENYRKNAAIIKIKNEEIKGLKELLNKPLIDGESENDCIEGMQMSGKAITDIPSGGTMKISDPTAETALSYHDEVEKSFVTDRGLIWQRIRDLQGEINTLELDINVLNVAIDTLREWDKYIINMKFKDTEKYTWAEISENFYRKFKVSRHPDTIRKDDISRIIGILKSRCK